MHASTLTRAAGITPAAVMLVLTNGLADAKLPAPAEERKAWADLAKAKVTWGDKAVALQTCRVQDGAVASYQAGGKAAYTQPGVSCVDPGSLVAPAPAILTPAPMVKGWTVGSNVTCSLSGSITVRSPNKP